MQITSGVSTPSLVCTTACVQRFKSPLRTGGHVRDVPATPGCDQQARLAALAITGEWTGWRLETGDGLRYAMITHEVCAPLPTIALRPDESGLAILLRRHGRPIAFILEALAPSTKLGPADLDRLIGWSSAVSLFEQNLREELGGQSQPMTPHSLTVAVCTRARSELLTECLTSLLRLRNDADGAGFDVLVVDNAPPDDSTKRVVESMKGVRYVCEPKPGLDFARNRALAEADSKFVAFLDDDVEVDPEWLPGLVEALAENPDAAVVTGLVLPYELVSDAQIIFERHGGFRRGFAKLRYQGSSLSQNPLYPTGAGIFGAGCNMVVRRDIVQGLGGFDEALDTGASLPGGGDIDIFYRVIRAGHPLVYEPRMLVFHKHRRDFEKLRRQYWTWGTGFMAFVAKTYSADPSQRSKLRRLISWWLRHQLQELNRSVRGRSELSPNLVVAELVGGTVGLAGTYRRSVRRVERIRRESE